MEFRPTLRRKIFFISFVMQWPDFSVAAVYIISDVRSTNSWWCDTFLHSLYQIARKVTELVSRVFVPTSTGDGIILVESALCSFFPCRCMFYSEDFAQHWGLIRTAGKKWCRRRCPTSVVFLAWTSLFDGVDRTVILANMSTFRG